MFRSIRAFFKDFFEKDYHHLFCDMCKKYTTHENRICMICSGHINIEEKIND